MLEVTSVLGPYPSHPNEEIVAFVPKDYPSWESRRGIWRYRRFNVHQFGLSDDPPPRAIGNLLANTAEYHLNSCAPYPGEAEPILTNWDRIIVYRISPTHHIIVDSYYYDTELPSEIEIRTSWLETPDFCIVQWYADERGRMNGLTPHLDWPVGAPWNGAGRMGDMLLESIEELLMIHQPFAGDYVTPHNPNIRRFEVRRSWPDEEYFEIRDNHLDFVVKLDVDLMEN